MNINGQINVELVIKDKKYVLSAPAPTSTTELIQAAQEFIQELQDYEKLLKERKSEEKPVSLESAL